jgi:prepilin-type N-terminal cleavage/methylation domain-containing protein
MTRTKPHARRGFTFIECAVVIVVVTIIASIAIVNFIRFRSRADYTSCVSNQRHVLEASVLYVSTANPGTRNIDVNVLTAGGWLTDEAADCPKSTVHAQNDYRIHIDLNRVSAIDCKILPAEHLWAVP